MTPKQNIDSIGDACAEIESNPDRKRAILDEKIVPMVEALAKQRSGFDIQDEKFKTLISNLRIWIPRVRSRGASAGKLQGEVYKLIPYLK